MRSTRDLYLVSSACAEFFVTGRASIDVGNQKPRVFLLKTGCRPKHFDRRKAPLMLLSRLVKFPTATMPGLRVGQFSASSRLRTDYCAIHPDSTWDSMRWPNQRSPPGCGRKSMTTFEVSVATSLRNLSSAPCKVGSLSNVVDQNYPDSRLQDAGWLLSRGWGSQFFCG